MRKLTSLLLLLLFSVAAVAQKKDPKEKTNSLTFDEKL
jgi:hypothetical protein